MKSKRLKGFTLIECIVAMAIIGITSLLMVQVYGTVAKMNQDNNRINNSLEAQMKYAEKEIAESVQKEKGGALKELREDADADSNPVKIICVSSYDNTDADVHADTAKGDDSRKITFVPKTTTSSTAMYKTDSKKADKFSAFEIKADVDLYIIGVKANESSDYVSNGTKVYDNNNIRYKFLLPKKVSDYAAEQAAEAEEENKP
ncbi:MAG: type II secretion system protein [Oscillospiraceae bacterium]